MNTSCCTNPIRINTLLIKNRIVFPAMCTKYAAPDGGVTERMLRYYEERAKGGAGLVTIEATSVDPTGNSFSRGLSIADDARLPGLTDLARRVKRHGARISIQLQHGGRAALPQFSGHAVPLVSAIPGVTPYDNSVILSEEERPPSGPAKPGLTPWKSTGRTAISSASSFPPIPTGAPTDTAVRWKTVCASPLRSAAKSASPWGRISRSPTA